MQTDLCGYQTSLATPEAAAQWDAMHLAFLAHGAAAPQHLAAVLAAEPGFVTGHAAKGLFYLMLGRAELRPEAAAAAEAGRVAARQGNPTWRERRYLAALGAWLAGQPQGAVEEMEKVLAEYPRDSLAMKIGHAIRFILGDAADMRRSLEAVRPVYDSDHPATGYLLGCHAFALEETGAYGAARDAGESGLALAANDAWGLHAVAHVHDMTADAAAGIAWLDGREDAWAHCNNFRFHVWWHKALMHLDLGQTDRALALYDAEIRRDKTDDYRDISNATSLLMRLELEGVAVGDRWEELAEFSAARTEDGCLIFADLHYLLALIGGARDTAIDRLMTRIRRDAAAAGNEVQRRMARPGLQAAVGLEAFGAGDYASAYLNLAAARGQMQAAGGSHAQRDVFERLTIDAAIRGGYTDAARGLLDDRVAKRGGHRDGYAEARRALLGGLQAPVQPGAQRAAG